MNEDQTSTGEEQNRADTPQPELAGVDFDDGKEETPTEEKEPEKKEKELSPTTQDNINKKINRLVAEKHDEKRRRVSLEKKVAEFEAEKDQETDVPPVPDPYDDNYEQKIAERDRIIKRNTELAAKKAIAIEIETNAIVKKVKDNINRMYTVGEEHGITKDELVKYDNEVGRYIEGRQDLANFILGQEDSAFILKTLANSPLHLDELSRLNDAQAAGYIASTVRETAKGLVRKKAYPPKPLDVPGGKAGGSETDDPFLRGVKFF